MDEVQVGEIQFAKDDFTNGDSNLGQDFNVPGDYVGDSPASSECLYDSPASATAVVDLPTRGVSSFVLPTENSTT